MESTVNAVPYRLSKSAMPKAHKYMQDQIISVFTSVQHITVKEQSHIQKKEVEVTK